MANVADICYKMMEVNLSYPMAFTTTCKCN